MTSTAAVSGASATTTALTLVDTHVHLHACFDLARSLDAAQRNVTQVAQTQFQQPGAIGVLCLTEMAGEAQFQTLADLAATPHSVGDWTITRTADPGALRAESTGGGTVILLAGRQVITAEKLEVLALLTLDQCPDGLSLTETIAAIHAQDGVPVLPWAVGKWIGTRGKLVQALVNSPAAQRCFVADNSGRPGFWRRPPVFAQMEAKGRPVLLGTDPLPLAPEFQRIGQFGLAIAASLDPAHPCQTVKTWLGDSKIELQPYGQLEHPIAFVRNQLALRLA